MSTSIIGRIIKSRYKLIDERGNGNFGSVYIARDLLTNYLYAAKIMHMDHVDDQELLERFKREAYILYNLNDPHVVRVIDYGNEDTTYFIIMHHVDGQNLKYYIQNFGPLEPLRALDYIHQAAEGLEAAHQRGVVHRDIKPQNILITNKGVVKIADFGLSRSKDMFTITHSDKFMGTAYYIPPEQAQSGHSADIRSDLYSLGVVFFEMLAGSPPFAGGTVVDIILKHTREEIPSLYRQRPDLPPEVDAFVKKALAKVPDERFQTPREFIEGIELLQKRIRGDAFVRPRVARLILLRTGQVFVLKDEKMIVGRPDPKREIHPDIQIDDKNMTVGRMHACFIQKEGAWTIEDRNSRNKTRVNGEFLVPYEPHALKDGDLLQFGRIEARFELR